MAPNRRRTLRGSRCERGSPSAIGALLCLLVLVGCGPPPDVVLVVLDTTRADALSLHGNPRSTSPRLDALAESAVIFENAFTVAASTPPALAALMTGRLPHYDPRLRWSDSVAHGLLRFFPSGRGLGLPPSLPTLAERFRDAGYRTAGVVTNPYVKCLYGFDRGFDRYREIFRDDELVYGLAEHVVDGALEALDGAGEDPLFLYLHFMDPHEPYSPPEAHRAALGLAAVPSLEGEALRAWLDDPHPTSPGAEEVARHARGLYDASVHYMDAQIGRLLDALAERRRLDRALIAVVGDHGEEFLEHGSNRHRGTVYDELLHVPLLLKLPGVAPRRVSGLVRHFDAAATLLDFADLEPLPGSDAESLRPFVEERGAPPSLAAIGTVPVTSYGMPHRLFLRDARYKLVYDLRSPGRSELYDLADDPGERTNLYAAQPGLAARLLPRIEAALQPLEAEWQAVSQPRRRALATSRFEGLEASAGSRLVSGPEGSSELHAGPGQPAAFELPLLLFEEPLRIRVVLEAQASAPATVRLLWQDAEDPVWRRERGVVRPIPAGSHTVRLDLTPAGDLVGPLQIEVEPAPLRLVRLEVLDLSVPQSAGDLADPAPEAIPARVDATTTEQLRSLGYVE